jgi:hypothetical protein
MPEHAYMGVLLLHQQWTTCLHGSAAMASLHLGISGSDTAADDNQQQASS